MASAKTDWADYAKVYDLMCDHNQAYQDILNRYRTFLESGGLDTPRVLDAGGGTGNFSKVTREILPNAEITLIDSTAEMLARAEEKVRAGARLNFQCENLEEAHYPDNRFDLIICVHALYALDDPVACLRKMRSWLNPGGAFFICDLGKPLDIPDWRSYLFRTIRERDGFFSALSTVAKGWPVSRHNQVIRENQLSGRYWTHEPEPFADRLTSAGLVPEEVERVYRGYSNLALKPLTVGIDDQQV